MKGNVGGYYIVYLGILLGVAGIFEQEITIKPIPIWLAWVILASASLVIVSSIYEIYKHRKEEKKNVH